jgi:signal transduction histidine kinase
VIADPQSTRSATALESLVRTAVAQKELHGICEILRSVAHSLDAYGCFLWQASDESDLESNPPTGSLSVVAHWFDDGRSWALEGIELSSVVGQVAATRTPRNVPRVEDRADISRKFWWWVEQAGIRCFCAVPVSFFDGPRGALAIYRNLDNPFSERELEDASALADVLPGLYQSIRDRVSFDLVARIEELTADTSLASPLQLVCESIARTFNSHETSIFLRERLTDPAEYRLQATTWPLDPPLDPQSYHPGDAGITPWVMDRSEPIRLFNLGAYEPGKPIDENRFPGLIWRDPLRLVETMMKARGVSRREELPPLSYMCVPVMQGKRTLGAIRCCSMLMPPFIFASRDLALLRVASALVSKYWTTRTEIQAWRGFVQSIADLNKVAEQELARETPSLEGIRGTYLGVANELAAGRGDDFLNLMIDLTRQQVQLYERLGATIAERTKAQLALKATLEEQHQTYEDLFHQIKSPVNAAFETIRNTLEGDATREAYRSSLETLRSQLRRANRIAHAVGIFAELSAEDRIQAHRNARLQPRAFAREVTELAEDYAQLQEKYRNIRFEVVPRGFEVLNSYDVLVDQNLLFHALGNILDNAGKYSYANTTVRISAGMTGGGRFHVSVANRGLRIRPQDQPRLTDRGFRSDEAESASGDGSGIGLFIVKHVIEAHAGELLIIPANQDGETEVKMLFLAEKVRGH